MLHDLTLTQARKALAGREIGVVELVSACLTRIEATEPRIQAILTLRKEEALKEAKTLDADGPDPTLPLWGIPVTVKDALTTRGLRTTCGSRMLEHFVPAYDAHLVHRLKKAGAIILAKTNMDEFAMGSSTENSAFQTTRNPWNLNRVPGGSSGGSAAGIAAGQAMASIGTDTGGSIRQPAAFCGVVGLKPTYGRVSRFGLVAYGSSLDQAGPIARTAADCAAVLEVIAGHDPQDSTSLDVPVPPYSHLAAEPGGLEGLRIGLPTEYWGPGLDPEVREACQEAVNRAAGLGAEIVELSLPHTPYAIAAYYITAMAEASSNLARFDGVRYGLRSAKARDLMDVYAKTRTDGFGEEVQRRIMLGTYVLSAGYYDAYYRKAAQVRRLIRQDFLKAFESCDLIAGPACPTTAFGIGENLDDPLTMYLTDIFTISLNLSGLPGLSLPVGLGNGSGLPVGLQLFGPDLSEDRLLRTAVRLEAVLPRLPEPSGLA
ncbi:MAG: Asp-tRNA(Asn)/Glu-tRNA(Gln) amidotransferase subunit GatA [Deltaproteobacteria bacterium]|nr:Asp-tRNA(Asn)/Glu-tRNA(Gln) amidotransferase subunit GatA [Deltaproteobacteria bacterium]